MPTLNVFNAGGKLLPDAAIRVMLAMIMPDDQQSQRTFLAGVKQEADDCEDPTSYKPSKALFNKETFRGVRGGPVAGEMLLQYISLKLYTPEHASLNKVYWLCRRNAEEGWPLFGGGRVPKSTRRFQDFWAQFKSVAHLWAAWQIEGQSGGPEGLLALSQDDEKLVRFLGVAARLFLFAEFQAEHRQKIDLAPDPYIIQPDHLPDVKITPPPPTEWALRTLAEYRAPIG